MLGTIGLFLRSTDNDYQRRLEEVGKRETPELAVAYDLRPFRGIELLHSADAGQTV